MIETPECDEFQKTKNEMSGENFYEWLGFARKQEQRARLAETRLNIVYEKVWRLTKIIQTIELK